MTAPLFARFTQKRGACADDTKRRHFLLRGPEPGGGFAESGDLLLDSLEILPERVRTGENNNG